MSFTRAPASDSIALAAFPAADSDPLLLQPALSSAVLVRAWEPPTGARPSNRAPYDDDFEVSAHLADNPHASIARGKTHFVGAHRKAAVDQLEGGLQPCDAVPPDTTLSGNLRETTRARFANLPEVLFCNVEPEQVAASVFISGEPAQVAVLARPATQTRTPFAHVDLAGPDFIDQRHAPLSKPLLRARDGVVVVGTENQTLGLAEQAHSLRNIIVVTSIREIVGGSSSGASAAPWTARSKALVVPLLRDVASQNGLRVSPESRIDYILPSLGDLLLAAPLHPFRHDRCASTRKPTP